MLSTTIMTSSIPMPFEKAKGLVEDDIQIEKLELLDEPHAYKTPKMVMMEKEFEKHRIEREKKLEEELKLQKESNDIQRLKLEIEKNSADTDSRLREMELSIHQKELDMNAERMKYEHKDRIFTGCLQVGSLLLSAVTIAMITVTNLANMNFERKEMGRTPTGIKDSIKSAFDVLKTLKH